MPYIKSEIRPEVRPCAERFAETEGELNFQVTTLVLDYLATKKLSYSTINDILGALDGAAKEFYRRVAAPYEDSKIASNGDVYPARFAPRRVERLHPMGEEGWNYRRQGW